MNLSQAISILEKHNAWRRDRGEMTYQPCNPAHIGLAIDEAVRVMKEHETAMMVLHQIADKPRKTKEQRLAKSCVVFLASMKK